MIIATKAKESEVLKFIDNGVLDNISDLDVLTDKHKQLIGETLTEVSGVKYNYLPCVYMIYGEQVDIVKDGDSLSDIFDLRSGDFIFQLDKSDSLCYTISFTEILELASKFPELDDFSSELFKKRFIRRLNPTDVDGETLIAFIPNIYKEDVKLYTYLDNNRFTKIIDTSNITDSNVGDVLKGYMNLF